MPHQGEFGKWQTGWGQENRQPFLQCRVQEPNYNKIYRRWKGTFLVRYVEFSKPPTLFHYIYHHEQKLWCTLRLKEQIHSTYFYSTPICTLCRKPRLSRRIRTFYIKHEEFLYIYQRSLWKIKKNLLRLLIGSIFAKLLKLYLLLMFIVFPRLLADILGFSGAVGLSVIVSAMEVRTNIKGGRQFNCKSANIWVHSALASPKICQSANHISIFFLLIRKSEICKLLMFASLKSTQIVTLGQRGWKTSFQKPSHKKSLKIRSQLCFAHYFLLSTNVNKAI
jgi:hypothetical protein